MRGVEELVIVDTGVVTVVIAAYLGGLFSSILAGGEEHILKLP